MKKQLVLLAFALSVFITYGQKLNDEHQTKSGKPFLWGAIDKAGLESANYSEWFNKNYEAYEPSTSAVNQLKKPLEYNSNKSIYGYLVWRQ